MKVFFHRIFKRKFRKLPTRIKEKLNDRLSLFLLQKFFGLTFYNRKVKLCKKLIAGMSFSTASLIF